MRDGERKVLTADDEFLNTLSARQALCRHRRWSHRQYSAPTLVPTSRRNYFDDVDIPDVVSGTDLLPLPATDLHCIDMYRRHQADRSTTMPNALRGMYLLITALRGMWRRSNWHHLQGMKHILQIVFADHWAGPYIMCTYIELYMKCVYSYIIESTSHYWFACHRTRSPCHRTCGLCVTIASFAAKLFCTRMPRHSSMLWSESTSSMVHMGHTRLEAVATHRCPSYMACTPYISGLIVVDKTTDRIEDHDKLWNSLHAALLVHAAHATVCELFACLERQQNNRPTVTTYSYINMKEGK